MPHTAPHTKDAAFIARALDQANPNVLRMALYQATRDPALASMRLEKQPFWGGAFEVPVLAGEHVAEVKAKALDFLLSGAPSTASEPDLRPMMDMLAGAPVSDFFHEMGRTAFVAEEFPLGVSWRHAPAAETLAGFQVVIIGAGLAGMAAAIQLDRLGIPFVILERNGGVGGTWWVNDYPEARVDVPSHHYQFSFMRHYPWRHYFATQEELKRYAEAVAARYNLTSRIRFHTELTDARWDEAASCWRLRARAPDGGALTLDANALISAAGLFNAPNVPDIPGIESFGGAMFHSTQWDHSYDYAGKRVGQIGVGSTGAQLMPAIAASAAQLTIFQRTPQWMFEIEGYRAAISDEVQWLFDHVPHYWSWYSYYVFTGISGDPDPGLQDFDPAWQMAGGRISARNDAVRDHYIAYIHAKVGHDPDLVRKLTPDYPPLSRRPVVDNGWFDALKRENVGLVTDGIERVTPKGVLTTDGVEHELDLLLLCAGFKVERYLWPVRYEGRGGVTLESAWETDGARAYLGLTVPRFPNLFILYGPNCQARSGGLIVWLEIWARYAVSAIARLIESGKRAIEVKDAPFEDYNSRMDAAFKTCIWSESRSYYVNSHGRPGVMMPWKPTQYYEWVRAPNLDDYELR